MKFWYIEHYGARVGDDFDAKNELIENSFMNFWYIKH